MKQRKVKKELVLATYKDYVRHYGVKEGAKKWKEYTKGKVEKLREHQSYDIKPTEEVKDRPIEEMPLEEAEGDIEYRGKQMVKMMRTEGWRRYLEPQMKFIIKQYKDVYDDVQGIVELKVNQKIRQILQAVLEFPRDCFEDAEIIRKRREEREENAANLVGEESA